MHAAAENVAHHELRIGMATCRCMHHESETASIVVGHARCDRPGAQCATNAQQHVCETNA